MRCRQCGKKRYATRDAAEFVIRQRQGTREGIQQVEQRAYEAHGWWHTTSRTEWEDGNVQASNGTEG